MFVVLIGGGPDSLRSDATIAPFIARCRRLRVSRLVLVLAGPSDVARHYSAQYAELFTGLTAEIDVVALGEGVDADRLTRCEAVVVGGGSTPLYLEGLKAHASLLKERVASGVPYLGFSAGAMIAATEAIEGGYRLNGAEFCSVECSEGLDDFSLKAGLGLVPWPVDVHAAQAGTLGRAVEASRLVPSEMAVAIDEDTAVILENDRWRVFGSGRVWWIEASGPDASRSVAVSAVSSGSYGPLLAHQLPEISGTLDRTGFLSCRPNT